MTTEGSPGAKRRRIALIGGLCVGVLIGAAAGAALLSGASPEAAGPQPVVLHSSPVIVTAGDQVELGAATFCRHPDERSCRTVSAEAFVRPFGAVGWTRVPAGPAQGGYRFLVPAGLVPDQGFSYWLRFHQADGRSISYPPGEARSPIRVITTAGLPERRIPEAFSWGDESSADATPLQLPYGSADGDAGYVPGGGDRAPSGPSSFAIAPDGSFYVMDWVNVRIQVFAPDGSYERSIPAPDDEPMDIAIGNDGTIYLSTLGMGGVVYELSPDGAVAGRYRVGYGLPTRIQAATDGPHVQVGDGEWLAVRAVRGVPLPAAAQTLAATPAIPLRGGGIGYSTGIDAHRVAVVWTRPDGSRAGSIVTLPPGVRPGVDYFVEPVADGGAIAAKGLWDDTHSAVAAVRFDATGRIVSFSLLPEPSNEQEAYMSAVRFLPPSSVLVVHDDASGVRYDRYEVGS